MAYLVPRVLINQEFTQVTAFSDQPLSALILGPQFNLHRYSVAAEKASTAVGSYAEIAGTPLAFPNQNVGTLVDSSYTKVFFENAEVEYYPNSIATVSGAVTNVAVPNGGGKVYPNRVAATSLVFATGNNVNRSACFSNRDVKVGDLVTLSYTNNVTPFNSKITAILNSVTAATLGTPTHGTGNSDTHDVIASGTYTGTTNLTYKIKVVRAGPLYDGTNASTCARVAITSTNVDSSPTVNAPAAAGTFAVGSYGVFAAFPTGGGAPTSLTLSDTFYIPVTAAASAAANVLVLADTLPADLLLANPVNSWSISTLSTLTNFQVNQAIFGDNADQNWTENDTLEQITVNTGITAPVAGLVSNTNFEVIDADVYIEHRDLVQTNSVSIGVVSTTDQVEALLGTVDPDNPIAQGVYDAVLNSNGVNVYYGVVQTNDLSGYNGQLALAKKTKTYYGLVPLTFDVSVQQAVVAHVNALSTADYAQWRVCWLSSALQPTKLIYNLQTNGNPWLATLTDDPTETGTQYTYLTATGATFLTDGVRVGDTLQINYTTDLNGNPTFESYTVTQVLTETNLIVAGGASAPGVSTPSKFTILRNYSTDEQIATLAAIGGSFANRRVRMVFPDEVQDGTVTKAGYFAAAACAGLRSGVAPHQGLTNTTVLGITNVTGINETFTSDQLDILAAAGFYILTQDVAGSEPYIRHQLTTDMSGLNTQEDSVTTNVDSISYGLQAAMAPFIGKYNIDTTALALIRAAVINQLKYRQTGTFTASAGNQLIAYSIVSLAQDATFQDRVTATVNITVPYPLNYLNITLVV